MAGDPTVGSTVGEYRIVSLIARGGMGDIYLAEDVGLLRRVALKFPSGDLERDPTLRERFLRETRAAASLDHPNVLTVFAAGESDGRLFLAMRHVDGRDLSEVIARDGPMPLPRVTGIVAQIAAALDAAHERGLVHRDVKPSNVLLADDRAYLTDFGLARRIEGDAALTATSTLVGTLNYVAPEAIEGRDVDGRADQYALGCLTFELLTGDPPFQRPTEAATLYAHLHDDLPRDDRTSGVEGALRRATAKAPQDRFPSCSAFATAIGAPSERDRRSEDRRSRRSRRRLVAAVATVAAVVAIVAVSVSLRRVEDGPVVDRGPVAPPDGSLVRLDPETGEVQLVATDILSYTPVDVGIPADLEAGEGGVWSERGALIVHVDPDTGDVEAEIANPVFAARSGLAVGHRTVWVGACELVHRINPATDEFLRPIRLGADCGLGDGKVGVDRRSVWAVDPGGSLVRIDPGTLVTETIQLEGSVDLVAAGDGLVWAVDRLTSVVIPLSARDGSPLPSVDASPTRIDEIAAGVGGLWILDRAAGVVVRLGPDGDLSRQVRVGADPADIAAGLGWIWVAGQDGKLYRIDPLTLEVSAFDIGAPLLSVAVDEDRDRVWVGVFDLPD